LKVPRRAIDFLDENLKQMRFPAELAIAWAWKSAPISSVAYMTFVQSLGVPHALPRVRHPWQLLVKHPKNEKRDRWRVHTTLSGKWTTSCAP
jgi:hypothetical protein